MTSSKICPTHGSYHGDTCSACANEKRRQQYDKYEEKRRDEPDPGDTWKLSVLEKYKNTIYGEVFDRIGAEHYDDVKDMVQAATLHLYNKLPLFVPTSTDETVNAKMLRKWIETTVQNFVNSELRSNNTMMIPIWDLGDLDELAESKAMKQAIRAKLEELGGAFHLLAGDPPVYNGREIYRVRVWIRAAVPLEDEDGVVKAVDRAVLDSRLLDRTDSENKLAQLVRCKEAIATLPKGQRDVLELHLAGRTTEQIAEELGIAPATARVQLARGKAALRNLVGPKPKPTPLSGSAFKVIPEFEPELEEAIA